MARRGSATIQEELYSTPDEPAREELDDARLLDLDAEKESPFLRAQKRVPARRSPLPKKTAATLAVGDACHCGRMHLRHWRMPRSTTTASTRGAFA